MGAVFSGLLRVPVRTNRTFATATPAPIACARQTTSPCVGVCEHS
jgi:hypothetical protein